MTQVTVCRFGAGHQVKQFQMKTLSTVFAGYSLANQLDSTTSTCPLAAIFQEA